MTSSTTTAGPAPLNLRVAPTTDPLISSGLSGWLGRGWSIVRRSHRPLLALAAGYALIGAIAGVTLSHLGGPWMAAGTGSREPLPLVLAIGLIATSPVSSFLQAASTYVAIRDAAGRSTTPREVTRFAARRALPLAGWWLAATSLVVVGWLLFALPGVYLAVVFGGALTGVVVVERRGLSRCFLLISGRFWATLGRLSLFGLFAGPYYLAAGFVPAALLGTGSAGAIVATSALTIPLGAATSAFLVATYAELRYHENRCTTTDRLAAELTQ